MRQFLSRRAAAWLLAATCIGFALVSVQAQPPNAPDARIQPDKPTEIAKPKKRGFQWTANPQEVVPRSGKRNHLFYLGEAVTFELGPAAHRFEVRDYHGDVIDQGPVAKGAAITCRVTAPGWYKLYVYGKPVVAAAAKPATDPGCW